MWKCFDKCPVSRDNNGDAKLMVKQNGQLPYVTHNQQKNLSTNIRIFMLRYCGPRKQLGGYSQGSACRDPLEPQIKI